MATKSEEKVMTTVDLISNAQISAISNYRLALLTKINKKIQTSTGKEQAKWVTFYNFVDDHK